MFKTCIIIPILNEAKYLPVLLNRLKKLSTEDMLFVDGGSTDRSCDILKEAGVSFCTSEMGRATQMNTGAAIVKADILIFLHADTWLENRHLKAIDVAMQQEENIAGRFDICLSGSHRFLRVIEKMINIRSRMSRISTGDQVMFVRKTVFDAIGGFPDLALMEDIALSRLLKKKGRVACLRETVMTSSRRWEKKGILRTVCLMWWLRLLFLFGVSAERLQQYYVHQR